VSTGNKQPQVVTPKYRWTIEITREADGESRGSANALIGRDLIRSPLMRSHDGEAVFQSLKDWIECYEEQPDVVKHS